MKIKIKKEEKKKKKKKHDINRGLTILDALLFFNNKIRCSLFLLNSLFTIKTPEKLIKKTTMNVIMNLITDSSVYMNLYQIFQKYVKKLF